MIIKVNHNGTISNIVTTRIFKGSHNVHELNLLAPFSSEYTIVFVIRLPNGNRYSDIMTFREKVEGLGRWSYPINSTMTSIEGKVDLSFNISFGDNVQTTAKTYFLVEDSVLLGDEFEEHVASFNELLKMIKDQPGGGENVWVGEIAPDGDYTTWFKTIPEEEPLVIMYSAFGESLSSQVQDFGEEIKLTREIAFGETVETKEEHEIIVQPAPPEKFGEPVQPKVEDDKFGNQLTKKTDPDFGEVVKK